jgi:PIN domain nuclease of toxin-antitoxin system
MSAAVVDTHVVVWYLADHQNLSPAARSAISAAAAAGQPLSVPSICLVELVYLTERNRLVPAALQRLREALGDPRGLLRLAPLDLPVTDALVTIPRDAVPDMPDRIIAATATALGVPLITRDARLRRLPIRTIW